MKEIKEGKLKPHKPHDGNNCKSYLDISVNDALLE